MLTTTNKIISASHQVKITNDLWENLSLAQKFSAASLAQFGFVLDYIYRNNNQAIAILKQGVNVASIKMDGSINTSAELVLIH